MNIAKDIEPITELKKNTAGLIEKSRRTRSPIVITQNGKAAAVLQDVKSFEQQRQALLLLKLLVEGEQAHQSGNTISQQTLKKQTELIIKKFEAPE